MWKHAAVALAILAALVGGALVGISSSDGDPTSASSLFVRPTGADARACGAYIATWLDVLHAEDGFPINELKADVGQGPLWVAVTDVWRMALDLETTMGREEVGQRLAPTIDAACEDPGVRAQFLQLQATEAA